MIDEHQTYRDMATSSSAKITYPWVRPPEALRAYQLVWIIGTIEIFIGGITLLATALSLLFSSSSKPPNVLFFVLATASISTYLGIGILNLKKRAYELLIYFASVVILSKVLIFMNIIYLNNALETSIPFPIKNVISIFYHAVLILYLTKSDVKKIFQG